MNIRIKRNLQKVALVVTMVLLGVLLTASSIMFENAVSITAALNQSDYRVETVGGSDEEVDSEYFDSDFDSIKEVAYNGFLVQEKELAEGSVLLKNENGALPLEKGSKVSLFGMTANVSPFYGAGGSGGINTADAINWVEAFGGYHYTENEPKRSGLTKGDTLLETNPELTAAYEAWSENDAYTAASSTTNVRIGDVPWSVVQGDGSFSSVGSYGDAAIYIIKRTGGEGYDLPATSSQTNGEYSKDATLASSNDGTYGDYLQLSETEKSVLAGLQQLKEEGTIKKIVLILNMASTIQLDFLKDDVYGIDACLWVGGLGEAGSVGVAKLLVGEYNPSGGTSVTMWYDNLNNPVNSNFSDQNYYFTYDNYADFGFNAMDGNSYQSTFTTYMVYQEGLYMGYKYTETRYEDYVTGAQNVGEYVYGETVAYPFGYGLSYTDFSFSGFTAQKEGDHYNVSVTVTNEGSVAGKTSVQFYVSKPYGEYAKENRIQVPTVELVEFGKTSVLEPGDSEIVTVEADEAYFTSYDTFGAGTYVLMDGTYYLTAAANAHEAANNILAAKGYTPENTGGRMDAAGDASLVQSFRYTFNDETYSFDTATGYPVQNQFDYVDINTYEGRGDNSVRYYDRSDWEGTIKLSYRENGKLVKPHAELTMTQQMADQMRDQMDADVVIQKGGEYPTYGADNGLKLINLMDEEYDAPVWDDLLDQLTWEETIDLLSNGRGQTIAIESVAKPAVGDSDGPNGFKNQYQEAVGGSRWAGPTHPYGERVNDPDLGAGYSVSGFPSYGVLASSFNKELAAEVGNQLGEEGLWAGWAGWYGTGLNILRTNYVGRTSEYYSEDAILTGLIAAPQVKEVESKGVHAYIKHFALNESETARHGCAQWITEQALRETYLRAFEIVIEEGESFNTMTSFNRIGVVAAANSVELTNFLRNECGLPGIVLTDCSGDMTDGSHGEAYVSRFCDMALGATTLNLYNYGAEFADYTGSDHYFTEYAPASSGGSGEYGDFAQTMREACKRILYSAVTSNAMCGFTDNQIIVRFMPPWQVAMITADVVVGVLLAASVVWLVVDLALGKRKEKLGDR